MKYTTNERTFSASSMCEREEMAHLDFKGQPFKAPSFKCVYSKHDSDRKLCNECGVADLVDKYIVDEEQFKKLLSATSDTKFNLPRWEPVAYKNKAGQVRFKMGEVNHQPTWEVSVFVIQQKHKMKY